MRDFCLSRWPSSSIIKNANTGSSSSSINEEQSEQIDEDFEEQATENEESPNSNSKKRKNRFDAVIKGITMAANILGEKLKKAANNMNQAILGETEVQKKASMVIPEISKMWSLSASDRFKASRKIMRDPETVLSFWNLEGEDREDFVKCLCWKSDMQLIYNPVCGYHFLFWIENNE
ncbi:hypothetical protein LXL04_027389 [Taraxacum kok-saghyz]